MKKWLTILLLILMSIPIVTPICCELNSDCIVTETCQDGACGDCSITVYNPAGSVNMTLQNLTAETVFTYYINLSDNLSLVGTYPYIINCTTNKTCEGDCQIEMQYYCGRDSDMVTGVALFLLLLNIGVFIVPAVVKRIHDNNATNYIIKRMFVLSGFVILWFNTLIIRHMAISYNLGIDTFLETYWWFFTILMFGVIFMGMYFTTMGALKMAKEAKINKRMGYDGESRY